MLSGNRSAHRPRAHEQLSFSLAHLLAIITASAIILSCSATSEKTPTSAQGSPQSSTSAPRNDGADSDKLLSLALEGDAEAQYQLATRYYATTDGAIGDYAQASHWWHLAAQQGLAKAQFALGVLYANGRGVNTDYARAVHWYRQAAKQGLAEAQYNLGMHYWLSRGMPRDAAMAIKWLRKAADQGLPQAQHNLGLLEERYTRAAAQEIPAAQHKLQASPDILPWKPNPP
jgi:TPR repeat protein